MASGEEEAQAGARVAGIVAKMAEEEFGKDAAEVTAGDVAKDPGTTAGASSIRDAGANRESSNSAPLGEMHLENKIIKQMRQRGWTRESLEDTIVNPHRTARTTDHRWRPDGTRNDDPATVYFNEDGSYVVRNDATDDIVQVSDKKDPEWKHPYHG